MKDEIKAILGHAGQDPDDQFRKLVMLAESTFEGLQKVVATLGELEPHQIALSPKVASLLALELASRATTHKRQ